VATLLGLLLAGWGLYEYAAAGAGRVKEMESALRDYKTDAALNRNREDLLRLTRSSPFRYEPPRWNALSALAMAWASGWQDRGKAWTEEEEAKAREILARVDGVAQPEAELARGTVHAAWCRLGPIDLARGGHCDAALVGIAAFFRGTEGDPTLDWMRVEAAWTEVLVHSHATGRAIDTGQSAAATAAVGLSRCDDAMAWLQAAPVNDRELVQDCVVLAGLAEDLDRYRAYASWLLVDDGATPRESTEAHLYRAAGPRCADANFRRKGSLWTQRSGDPWCLAVGHYARGCTAESLDVIARNGGAGPAHAWTTLWDLVIRHPTPRSCSR
jgi:hypothetical protein